MQYFIKYTTIELRRFHTKIKSGHCNGRLSDAGEGGGIFCLYAEIYTQGMDYLFYWYGKIHQSTIFESRKKQDYLFNFVSTSGNDNGAYTFWKKNLLKNRGQVILSKTFYGGIKHSKSY